MPRRPRRSLPDRGFFHVFARGVDTAEIYRDDDDRRAFLGLLGRVADRHFVDLHAFCLMTTHYHLVLEAGRESLSRAMHRLNGVYAQAFNERHGRVGHVFAGRFGARAIDDELHLVVVCAYVVANPVRAGICETPTQHRPWVHSRFGLILP
jgi:REP element-mobilizing transposase RayT